MTEHPAGRRRQAYSKLICTGCRARRIRCLLPDTTIQPSPEPQPKDRACQRCRNHGLDCVVDFTTLGRPAQKRSRIAHDPIDASGQLPQDVAASNPAEPTALDVDDFILTQNGPIRNNTPDNVPMRKPRLSRKELSDTMNNSYNLLAAMLARDKQFASALGSQPFIQTSIFELVDSSAAALLDDHLVWHRLHRPAIPSLPKLRRSLHDLDAALPQMTSGLFLLILLYDLALDVPSPRLAALRSLQPTIRALVYHHGQKLFFSLPRNHYTVLALSLATQYRPLSLTSSRFASTQALRALPQLIMEKYVAADLSYSTAGSRLLAALEEPTVDDERLRPFVNQCCDWIRLSISEDLQNGIFGEWTRRIDRTAIECLDALRCAAESRHMPADTLYEYSLLLFSTQILANIRDMTENWKDLDNLEEVINGHRIFCDQEKDNIHRILHQTCHDRDLLATVSHLADMECQKSHMIVVGSALFFSVMAGAHAATHSGAIQVEQAMGVSDNIISELLSKQEDDPTRGACRIFLEKYGADRMNQLERYLRTFVTAADTLRLNDIPYIPPIRDTVGWITVVCKDIVESNAARLKGWGVLDDRVDAQMNLFTECARRLENMSAGGGTNDALARGCLLTGSAKLIRSLRRILQGFKKKVATSSQFAASSDATSGSNAAVTSGEGGGPTTAGASTSASVPSGWDDGLADELLSDWSNWPQVESLDMSDIFGVMNNTTVREGNDTGAV